MSWLVVLLENLYFSKVHGYGILINMAESISHCCRIHIYVIIIIYFSHNGVWVSASFLFVKIDMAEAFLIVGTCRLFVISCVPLNRMKSERTCNAITDRTREAISCAN